MTKRFVMRRVLQKPNPTVHAEGWVSRRKRFEYPFDSLEIGDTFYRHTDYTAILWVKVTQDTAEVDSGYGGGGTCEGLKGTNVYVTKELVESWKN